MRLVNSGIVQATYLLHRFSGRHFWLRAFISTSKADPGGASFPMISTGSSQANLMCLTLNVSAITEMGRPHMSALTAVASVSLHPTATFPTTFWLTKYSLWRSLKVLVLSMNTKLVLFLHVRAILQQSLFSMVEKCVNIPPETNTIAIQKCDWVEKSINGM